MYSSFKHNFGCEKYLYLVKNDKFRLALTRFRASSHILEIERGRYTVPITPEENRLCHTCDVVENEKHFLIHCTNYNEQRCTLFTKVSDLVPDFLSLSSTEQFIFLLSNNNSRVLTWVGKFIYDAFNSRSNP